MHINLGGPRPAGQSNVLQLAVDPIPTVPGSYYWYRKQRLQSVAQVYLYGGCRNKSYLRCTRGAVKEHKILLQVGTFPGRRIRGGKCGEVVER